MPQANPESITLTALHARLIEKIRQNKPHVIHSWMVADQIDFDDRGQHLADLLADVVTYARACVQDLRDKTGDMRAALDDVLDTVDGLSDTRDDLVGALANCADDMRNGMGRAA